MFNFDKCVLKKFKVTSITTTMKDICTSTSSKTSRNSNRNMGIYALYLDGQLMKIGRAVTGYGIYTRMKQYYEIKKEGIAEISDLNKDQIIVKYFNLPSRRDCWAAEKFLQAEAYYSNEKMLWDHEITENERIVHEETNDEKSSTCSGEE